MDDDYVRSLKFNFGLEADTYRAILEAQEGRCAICRRRPRKGGRLRLDWDPEPPHEIRGLLCLTCQAKAERWADYMRHPPAQMVRPLRVPADIAARYQRRLDEYRQRARQQRAAKRAAAERWKQGRSTAERFRGSQTVRRAG